MYRRNSWFWAVAKAVVIASGLLMVATPGYATENARERRDARDTKQESRQEAREQKLDCRAANQKTTFHRITWWRASPLSESRPR